ncbi:MAG: prepilin-type cleavage/methylation domain-containing protein [Betaproteobacteria bacterium]
MMLNICNALAIRAMSHQPLGAKAGGLSGLATRQAKKIQASAQVSRLASAMPAKLQQGIALLESLIAILIFSMGIIAVAGLQGFMVKGAAEAKNRTDASFIAQRQISMMWANSANLANFAETEDDPAALAELPGGTRTTKINDAATGDVTVTVRWQAPGEPAHQYIANAFITGG